MVLRYVSAKSPDALSGFFSKAKGLRLSIVSGPLFAKGRWFVWYTSDTGQDLKNINLED